MSNGYILDSVIVKDFFNNKNTVELNFKDNTNFVIGENGLGKTTLINLVAGVLEVDTETVMNTDFTEIEIKLCSKKTKTKPIIKVIITNELELRYQIKEKSSDKDFLFNESLNASFRDRSYRNSTRRVHGREDFIVSELKTIINSFLEVSWLTIHRTSRKDRFEDNSFESTVDMKIKQISNQLIRYFSSLDNQASKQLESFQKNVFNLLIDSDTKTSAILNLNLETEKKSLKSIYKELNIIDENDRQNEIINKKVDKHFESVKKVKERILKNSKPTEDLKEKEIISLYRTIIAHDAIENWEKYEKFKETLYKQKNIFLDLLSDLFKNKNVKINEKNELKIYKKNNDFISLLKLSSGEKQMLIILAEALLQENKSSIYIADEPELSLHISWQESLVRNILHLNKNVQLIFATHSPDIVSNYTENLIHLEKHFK